MRESRGGGKDYSCRTRARAKVSDVHKRRMDVLVLGLKEKGEEHRILWALRLAKASAWGSSSSTHASNKSLKSSCSGFSSLAAVPALSGL